MVLLFNISISFFLGILLFYSGLAQKADEFSSRHLGFYQKNIKITEIKKEIFLKKLKEIGVTKEVLKEHPELKKKIELKFDEKVLGKIYHTKEECLEKKFSCEDNSIFFKDKKGCGCKKIYR
jgi:hypothetical protein